MTAGAISSQMQRFTRIKAMTQITIDFDPTTYQHILSLLDEERKSEKTLTFVQLVNRLIGAQIGYLLEVERMKPALIQHVGEDWL
jgi:hypothetical protein